MATPVNVALREELAAPRQLLRPPWLDGRSGAWWLDPRTKLALLLIVNVISMNVDGSATAWAARSLAMAGVAGLLLSMGKARRGLAFFAAFGAGLLVLQSARYLPGQWALIGGLGTMLVQFLPIVAMADYAIRTTQVSEVVAALERLRAPRSFVIPLSVVLRFLPTIAQEHRAIADAMRIRGISLLGATRNPITLLEYRVVPLLMSLVRIGDELTAAALTRGLGADQRRTHICRTGFGWRDGVTLGAFLLPVLVVAYGRVAQ